MFESNLHELKILPEYYHAVVKGIKTFEIRNNDRNYQVGDRLILKEYNPFKQAFTGNEIEKEVVFITDFEQKNNYIVMSII